MEKTPTNSRLKHRKLSTGTKASADNESKENEASNRVCVTPVTERKMFADLDDDSPLHIACTQEGSENVDVVWDWNSPQAKQGFKKTRKRLLVKHSPKITLKRHSSNNHIQNFDKLREELQSLKEMLSVPDNEDCLVLSPLEEAKYKDISNIQNKSDTPAQENCLNNDEDLFNDFADEELLLFSQKMEEDLNIEQPCNKMLWNNNNKNTVELTNNMTEETSVKICTDVKVNNLGFRHIKNTQGEAFISANDSLEGILQEFEGHYEEVTKIVDTNINQGIKNNSLNFPRTRSENDKTCRQMNTSKVEFHRTQSFESTVEHSKELIPQSKLDEIEKKRKEALAKLESKRKLEYSGTPVKCTQEEIERKRLEALAKREAKRQQEVIERKRQEALKRLELNRKKNATIVKSSLSKRF